MKWATAITTIPERLDTAFEPSFWSLIHAGFADLDGSEMLVATTDQNWVGLRDVEPDMVHKHSNGAFCHWFATAWELYCSAPHADRFAIFQDDILLPTNVRQYLDAIPYPANGYINLCCYPDNKPLEPTRGLHRASSSLGLGAQGLVFNNEAFCKLLSSEYLVMHPKLGEAGKAGIDGVIKSALGWKGIDEYVHWPSLIDHLDDVPSTIGHEPQPPVADFPSVDFDCLSWLTINEVGDVR